jgi:hypothetical protein
MNQIWIHRIHISQPVIDTIAINRSRKSFGFLAEFNSASLLDCGREVQRGEIILNKSDVVHQRSGANFHFGAVSVPADDLAAAAEAIVGRELPEKRRNPTVRPPNTLIERLQRLHQGIIHLAREVPDILKLPAPQDIEPNAVPRGLLLDAGCK